MVAAVAVVAVVVVVVAAAATTVSSLARSPLHKPGSADICVYCCMYVLYDMRTYLCDYMFGCVEQMHVCVEQMHIISNDIYHDGDGCFGWILDGEYACFGFLDGFGGAGMVFG